MAEQSTQEAIAEVWQLFREIDARFEETDTSLKETKALIAETTRNINKLEDLFTNQ